MIELQLCFLKTKIYNVVLNFEQNLLDLPVYLFDKGDLIWHFYRRTLNALTFTVTVKAKPDANPFKEISDNMKEKRSKVENKKS